MPQRRFQELEHVRMHFPHGFCCRDHLSSAMLFSSQLMRPAFFLGPADNIRFSIFWY